VIFQGSRYMGQPVVSVVTDAAGDTASAVYGPPPVFPVTFVYYTVKTGDRYDTLAYELYGIADYWWKIADANPEVFYPDNLIVGSIIRIPSS
jgi:LysM domain